MIKLLNILLKPFLLRRELENGEGLTLPKSSTVIKNIDTGQVIAKNGKWLRKPNDNEKVVITYEHHD